MVKSLILSYIVLVQVLVLSPTVFVTLDKFINLPESFLSPEKYRIIGLTFPCDLRMNCDDTCEYMLSIVPGSDKGLHV